MYLKEIKSYKLPAVKPSDSEGHVQKFSPPKAPKSPEESDIANDLKAYENQTVDVEGQVSGGEATAVEEDWFVLLGSLFSDFAHILSRKTCLGGLRSIPILLKRLPTHILAVKTNADSEIYNRFEEEEEEEAAAAH